MKEFLLGLVGYPLEHSFSPVLHQAALKALNIPGRYRLFPLPPTAEGERELESLLGRCRRGEIQGLNVTLPHKRTVLPHLDGLREGARAIGAVNTICRNAEGQLVGENTDAPGFWNDLKTFLCGLEHPGTVERTDKPLLACLIGAGGGARAVAYALLKRGWRLVIAVRTLPRTGDLIRHFRGLFPGAKLQVVSLGEQPPPGLSSVDLIVNATPVGMMPEVDESPWPENWDFPAQAAVYDLVYNPSHTKLLKQAAQAGLPGRSGGGMLVEQAALSFEYWTGHQAPRPVMRAALEEVLESRAGGEF